MTPGGGRQDFHTVLEKYNRFWSLVRNGKSKLAAAKEMGYAHWTPLRRLFERHNLSVEYGLESTRTQPQPETVDDIVQRRISRFERYRAQRDTTGKIRVTLPEPLPFGVLIIGDPHVDDDGTDIGLIKRHAELVQSTEGAYAACVGDVTNNWVGRLKALYANQSTTSEEAWQLFEWFVELFRNRWLFIMPGNHDVWNNGLTTMEALTRDVALALEPFDVVAEISAAGRGEPFTFNVRHNFKGHSQWNTVHGILKAAMMGRTYDVLAAGHTHVSGYAIVKDELTGKLTHCVQVASYKVYDDYAKEGGFRDAHISPSVFVVCDPFAKAQTGRVQVFHDIDLGVEFLRLLRRKRADARPTVS